MTERSIFWRRHLEAIDADGVSTAAYARREGLALGLLYRNVGALPFRVGISII
jgi:hypothetical protein